MSFVADLTAREDDVTLMHVCAVSAVSAGVLVVEVAVELSALNLGSFHFLSSGHPSSSLSLGSCVASLTGTAFASTFSFSFLLCAPASDSCLGACGITFTSLAVVLLLLAFVLLLLCRRAEVEVEVD